MRILDRYLIHGFLKSLLYCVAFATVLFVVVDIFNDLDEYLRHGLSLKTVMSYYLYLMPVALVEIAPIVCLVSLLYFLGWLGRNNELTAMKASGVSTANVLHPLLFVGIVTSLLTLLVSERLVPQFSLTSASIKESLIQKGRSKIEERTIPNVTVIGTHNRMIFAREYEVASQTLYDVIVFEHDEGQWIREKTTAKKAVFENGRWIFYKAVRYVMDRRGDLKGAPANHDRLEVNLDERPEDFLKKASEAQFMSSAQIRQEIEKTRALGRKVPTRLWVQFHEKIAFAFANFIIILLGSAHVLKARRDRTIAGAGTSLGIVLLYYATNSISLALGRGGYLPAVLSAWLANLAFAGVGIYWIKKTA